MDEEEKQNEQGEEKQKTPAEIMREMKIEYEKRLAEKDAEIASIHSQHAAEIRDILTGRDEKANKEMELADRVKQAAKQIKKNLGV
jgi:hypothetical protein